MTENELWAPVGKKSKPICSSFQPTYDFDLDCSTDMKAPLVVKWKEVNYSWSSSNQYIYINNGLMYTIKGHTSNDKSSNSQIQTIIIWLPLS